MPILLANKLFFVLLQEKNKMAGLKKENQEVSLVEQTQHRILEYIAENKYQFNSVLPKENEMADILGVSRVVIREAYSGLRTRGFLETKRKKGTIFVAPKVFGILKYVVMSGFLDDQSVEDLYELRIMLEIGMADYVVSNRTDDKIVLLQEIVEQEEQSSDPQLLKQLDIRFHSILYGMSGNKSLQYFQHLLSKLFALYTPRSANWKVHEMMTHRTLVEILKMGRPDLFRSAMRIHLQYQFLNQERNLAALKKVQE